MLMVTYPLSFDTRILYPFLSASKKASIILQIKHIFSPLCKTVIMFLQHLYMVHMLLTFPPQPSQHYGDMPYGTG